MPRMWTRLILSKPSTSGTSDLALFFVMDKEAVCHGLRIAVESLHLVVSQAGQSPKDFAGRFCISSLRGLYSSAA